MKINKFVAAVVAFNLLAEYSIRGFEKFSAMPVLLPGLILTYYIYFIILNSLTVKYKLNLGAFAVMALVFGMLYNLFFPQGGTFIPPFILGVNWVYVFFINAIFWVPVQSILGFYFAHRLVGRPDQGQVLSDKGLKMAFAGYIVMVLVFNLFAPKIGVLTPIGLITFSAAIFVAYKWYEKLRAKPLENTTFMPNRIYDALGVFCLVCFVYAGFFILDSGETRNAHPLNVNAMWFLFKAMGIVTAVMVVHRIASKKEIRV